MMKLLKEIPHRTSTTCIYKLGISLYTQINTLSSSNSIYVKCTTTIFIAAIIIFGPLVVTLNVLSVIGISPTNSSTAYNILIVGYFFILVNFSTYHAVGMIKSLAGSENVKGVGRGIIGDNTTRSFLQKNMLLMIMNFNLVAFVVTLGCFTILQLRNKAWLYLIVMYILRIEEYIILFIALAIIQTYTFGIGLNPLCAWKRVWRGDKLDTTIVTQENVEDSFQQETIKNCNSELSTAEKL